LTHKETEAQVPIHLLSLTKPSPVLSIVNSVNKEKGQPGQGREREREREREKGREAGRAGGRSLLYLEGFYLHIRMFPGGSARNSGLGAPLGVQPRDPLILTTVHPSLM
jgi:hypothetical protein